MTTQEAFDFVMSKVDELKELGIKVVSKPCPSKNNPKTIAHYNTPENIKPDTWVHISFKTTDVKHLAEIHEVVNYLGMCGITFDTGGCNGQRDWKLDWSFNYKEGSEDWIKRNVRDDLEDMLNNE